MPRLLKGYYCINCCYLSLACGDIGYYYRFRLRLTPVEEPPLFLRWLCAETGSSAGPFALLSGLYALIIYLSRFESPDLSFLSVSLS